MSIVCICRFLGLGLISEVIGRIPSLLSEKLELMLLNYVLFLLYFIGWNSYS